MPRIEAVSGLAPDTRTDRLDAADQRWTGEIGTAKWRALRETSPATP